MPWVCLLGRGPPTKAVPLSIYLTCTQLCICPRKRSGETSIFRVPSVQSQICSLLTLYSIVRMSVLLPVARRTASQGWSAIFRRVLCPQRHRLSYSYCSPTSPFSSSLMHLILLHRLVLYSKLFETPVCITKYKSRFTRLSC